MKNKLTELEKQIEEYSEYCKLHEVDYMSFPEKIREIFSFKIFGDNLLSIPSNLIINDDDEFELPFSFLNSVEEIDVFESEFKSEIPNNFIQIGSLSNATEIVLLNKVKNTIHVFHVSDVVDKSWLNYKLENEICDLQTFINYIRPQTVCCLINPEDYSKLDLFEIRNFNILKTNDNEKLYDEKIIWGEYIKLIKKSIENGFIIHYAPKKALVEFEK